MHSSSDAEYDAQNAPDEDALRTAIHRIRVRIGERRQARALGVLRETLELLEPHPYELSNARFQLIRRQQWFQAPPSGGVARCPPSGYLYRLTDVSSVAAATKWTAPDVLVVDTAKSLWSEFMVESRRRKTGGGGPWVPLRRFATGTYSGLRGFSWWTTLADVADDVIRASYRLGRPTQWIVKNTIVLRTPCEYVHAEQAARVPSVVEAFDSVIFDATREADEPASGVTINLENAPALREGVDEYVLGPVPVDRIEALPVLVDADAWAAYRASQAACSLAPPLYHALLSYYSSQED